MISWSVPNRSVNGDIVQTQSGNRGPPVLRSPCDFTVPEISQSLFQPVPLRRRSSFVHGNRDNKVATGYRCEGEMPPIFRTDRASQGYRGAPGRVRRIKVLDSGPGSDHDGFDDPSVAALPCFPPRVRRVNIKVPKFNGSKDWFPFIFLFERLAQSYGCSESEKLTMLLRSLEEAKMDLISLQLEEIGTSCACVKELMAQSFGVTKLPQSIRRQISSLSQESKESLEEF